MTHDTTAARAAIETLRKLRRALPISGTVKLDDKRVSRFFTHATNSTPSILAYIAHLEAKLAAAELLRRGCQACVDYVGGSMEFPAMVGQCREALRQFDEASK